jgi:diguanylate cyclase (GGDEF)-like protein
MTDDIETLWNDLFRSMDDLDGLYEVLGDWIAETTSADEVIFYRPQPLSDLPNHDCTMAEATVLRGETEAPDPLPIKELRDNESGIAELSHSMFHLENESWYFSVELSEEPPAILTENRSTILQFLEFTVRYHFTRERADVSRWFMTISQWLMDDRDYEDLLSDMLSMACEAMDHEAGGFYTLHDNEFKLTASEGFDVDEYRDRKVFSRDKLVDLGLGELDTVFEPADERDRYHLYLPLRLGPELIGIVALFETETGPESLTDSDEFTLNALSTVMTIALNNLELSTQLQEKVIHDELSGLKTNEYFRERVHQEIERGQRYGTPSSLLLIDLDRFEEINQEHGHPVGDAVLRELGRIIRNSVRRIDICSRVENDQFGILFPNTSAQEAVNALERLQEILNSPLMDVHGQDIEVNFSGGLAGFPEDAENVEELFRQVELALYEAKQTGRNRIVTSESVSEDTTLEGESEE